MILIYGLSGMKLIMILGISLVLTDGVDMQHKRLRIQTQRFILNLLVIKEQVSPLQINL